MEIKLKDEFIKLGQALKAAGLVDSGVVAKIVIQDGEVLVNGIYCMEIMPRERQIFWNLFI